jgi:hypothetical protein
MKCNAHLYLPWSVIAELAASTGAQLSEAKSDRPRVRVAALVECLDGGCLLFRLAGFAGERTAATSPERRR